MIAVAGYSGDAGKTTCAWALVSELQTRGFTVTVEKKTGTACGRDWLRCYAEPRVGTLERHGDEIIFSPERFPARDFVDDGCGSASWCWDSLPGITSRVPDDVCVEIVAYVTERRRAGVNWWVVAEGPRCRRSRTCRHWRLA